MCTEPFLYGNYFVEGGLQSMTEHIFSSGIAYTAERAESVLFSGPYFTGGTVMAVLKAENAPDNV